MAKLTKNNKQLFSARQPAHLSKVQRQPLKRNVEQVLSYSELLAVCELPLNLHCQMRNDKVKEVVLLMSFLGLRVSEAINFSWCQIPVEDKRGFLILGKGNKQRLVYNLFQNKYITKKANLKASSATFADQWTKISRIAIWKYLQRRSQLLKLSWMISPHTLRRSFASILQYDLHLSAPTIQQLLGHSQFSTTEKYLKKDPRFVVNSLKRSGIFE